METPDLALNALFVLTAGYAGTASYFVARKRRHTNPLAVGAGVFAAVAAYLFAVVLTVANLSAWAGTIGGLLLLGLGCYLVLRNDVPRGQALGLTAGAVLVVTGAGLFVSYLAVVSLIVTLATYQVVRLWWESRQTLVLMGTALGGMLAASAVLFGIALSQM